jgi:predicted ATPase
MRMVNFRRFSDLTIREISRTAKLVLIVGPNGCGKSSIFDGFLLWYRQSVSGYGGIADHAGYYRKSAESEQVQVVLHGEEKPEQGAVYVRTAHRNDPDFSVNEIRTQPNPKQVIRVERSIDNDQAVSDNYRRLVYDTFLGVYNQANNKKTVEALREELIGALQKSLKAVLGDLTLNTVSSPLDKGSFSFGKGASTSYHYKNLSGGEKAAFDLLLDLHLKCSHLKNTIYCIDEIETHLHTKVQGALLKEMFAIIPQNSQLWVSTHSLGVLRGAQELIASNPESVALISFDGVNHDIACELMPCNLNRVTWEKMLSITLDDLSHRIAPKTVIVCEGSALGNRRKDFDAEIFNKILGSQFPEVLFISGGASSQVQSVGVSVRDIFAGVSPKSNVMTLVDRDDKSAIEVTAFESKGGLVLPLRNIESYLLADDVLDAFLTQQNQQANLSQVRQIKQNCLTASVQRGNRNDDLKSAAGEIFVELRKLLNFTRCGDNSDAFMRDTLAPLIRPPLKTYDDLKAAIIDRLPK